MSTTLLQAMQALAVALDDEGTYAVSSSTSTAVTVGGLGTSTTGASTRRYDARYLALVSGTGTGQQRTIKHDSFVPSTGVVTISTGWNITPSANDLVMLTGLFPVFESGSGAAGAGEDTSYRQIINRACAKLLIPDRVLVAISTSDSYNLGATWPWLDRPERLNREVPGGWLKEPAPISGRRPVSAMWRGPSPVFDGNSLLLELNAPFGASGGSLTLEVLRPVNTWVNTGGTWAEAAPTTGLVNASDAVAIDVDDIVTAGMREVSLVLMNRNKAGRPSGNWAESFAFWDGACKKLRYWDHTLDLPAAAPAAGVAA